MKTLLLLSLILLLGAGCSQNSNSNPFSDDTAAPADSADNLYRSRIHVGGFYFLCFLFDLHSRTYCAIMEIGGHVAV